MEMLEHLRPPPATPALPCRGTLSGPDVPGAGWYWTEGNPKMSPICGWRAGESLAVRHTVLAAPLIRGKSQKCFDCSI